MSLSRRKIAAVMAGAGLVMWLALLPSAPAVAPPWTGGSATARGAYHVHSNRSDGSGSVDAIAQAAQRAGLQFVILTDHGDATRPPEPPHYRHGVLVIDAVELNTDSGHLVALDLPVAPYPLAGAAADVLEDVHRLGGFGIAAHPDSPRPSLGWRAWEAAVDGIEWLNADSMWRDESQTTLARAVLGYALRGPGALALLLDRPDDLLARWDARSATRFVPALAAADAHARLGADDPDASALHLPFPGYESVFRTFSNHVVLEQALAGDGAADAAALLAAVRQGRVFTVVEALAAPGGLEFTADAGGQVVQMGGEVGLSADVMLRSRVAGPPGTTLRLLRDGAVVHESVAGRLEWNAGEPGVYRIEAHVAGAPGAPPVPWILSNPIIVGLSRPAAAGPRDETPVSRIPAQSADGSIEKGSNDVSELVEGQLADARARRLAGEPPVGWRYALSGGAPAGQYAAVQFPVLGGLAAFDRVRFTVAAAAPVRVWVQVRAGSATERWGRTFYADREPRLVDLRLDSFTPIGTTSSAAPPLARIDSLLFVIDTLNNRPGASGSMTLSEIAFVR